ncbi:RNA-binding protein 45 [Homalodisca vitripennis]|nr:RNA-binding protein 45 [Homalodisca vitripennis]
MEENPHGYTGLWAQVSMDLPDEHIEWLFDIPPGLEYVRFFNEIPYDNPQYSRKVFAQYDSPGTAAYALRKLDGFEYPAGSRVRVKPDYQYSDRIYCQVFSCHAIGILAKSHGISSCTIQLSNLCSSWSRDRVIVFGVEKIGGR